MTVQQFNQKARRYEIELIDVRYRKIKEYNFKYMEMKVKTRTGEMQERSYESWSLEEYFERISGWGFLHK